MTGFLSEQERAELTPAELLPHETPIPTQHVSSDEFVPDPQNEKQREVEARLLAMGDELGSKQGLDRRGFFRTAAGMAASFVAMNEVYGPIFAASSAEAATPAMAQERADALKGQFIMDMHTHFLRDDTRIMNFVAMRTAVGKAGWNKQLADKEQTIEDLKFGNYVKEMFLDSDTKIALISSAPSDIVQDWFLTNEQMADARKKINDEAGSRRVFAHMIFTPGQPGWPGVKMQCAKSRLEPASSFIFLRASAICSLVRNQSCSMSEGALEISEILVSLSRNISFL